MKTVAGVFAISLFVALGCSSTKADGDPRAARPAKASSAATSGERVTVTVSAQGYEPGSINAAAGVPLTLVFKRTSEQGCGHSVVFPDRNIQRDLPLNAEVEIELTPKEDEHIAFTCGMGMFRGSIVATR